MQPWRRQELPGALSARPTQLLRLSAVCASARGVIETTTYSRSLLLSLPSTLSFIESFSMRNCAFPRLAAARVFVVLQANPVVNMVGLNDVFLAKQRVHFLMTLVCAAVDRVHLQERAELRSLAVAGIRE